jgi:hypothetical protein
MKRRSAQGNEKKNQAQPVIAYPPGYKCQPLTEELIMFSDSLMKCPADYRGVFKMLLKQFAADVGCGDSEKSQAYLKAINCGEEIFWFSDDLPTLVLVSVEEQCAGKRKRFLKIMPIHQLAELRVTVSYESEIGLEILDEIEQQASNKSPAKVFH